MLLLCFACQNCTSLYIGETARTLRSWVDDRKKPGTSPVYDHAASPVYDHAASPVYDHAANSTHSIDYEGVVVKA